MWEADTWPKTKIGKMKPQTQGGENGR